MKLLIVLSVIACGYAAKLDRTYLPPASAATAGGSPGSLTTPFGSPTGSLSGSGSGFGPASTFGSSGSGRFPQPAQPGLTGPSNLGQPSFGQETNQARPSNQYGAPSSVASGRGSAAPGFGPSGFGQGQLGVQSQPERPQASADRNAEILRYENENDGNTFAYSFETSNGISAEESGVATNGVQAQGGFAYTGDDGEVYKVTYTADENGYQPQGDHLPTSPPIPDEILRSIEENARAAAAGTQEGAYQPDENESGAPQQYPGSSPSYNQGQSSAQSYNQPQGSAQGPSQQYGAPNAASKSSGPFNQAQSGPRNQFGSVSSFNQGSPAVSGPQGPSSQFGAPTASGRGSAQGSQPFGSQNVASSAGPTRPFSAQNLQGNENGYQYNRPQVSASRPGQSSTQGRPSQQYGTPASGRGPSQGPSQQYNTPAINLGSNQVSQQYGAPTASGRGSSQGPQGSTQFNAPSASSAPVRGSVQGPSQQYGAPSASGRGSVQGQQYNAPAGPSRASGQAPSQQYGAPNAGRGTNQPQFGSSSSAAPSGQTGFSGSFPVSRQDQSSAQSRPQGAFGRGKAQNDNGYEYNRPQGTPFGQGPSSIRSQSGQNQPSTPQYNQPAQSAFSRPGSTSSQGPSSGLNFGTGPTSGPAAALVSQSLLPGSRGAPTSSRPTQSSFGSTPGQYRPGQPAMTDSTQYNQSGAPSRQGSQASQSPFSPVAPTFGGPRQPPSFSPESGYVY